jgi:lysophospholipid acyltransferase (LPLAT)-like uncharacterized protein
VDAQTGIKALLGSLLIRALGSTWRIHFDEGEIEGVRTRHPAVIYAFWHGRLLPLSFTHRHRSINVLASEHRDGELMGRTIRFLGFGHIRGSSTRRGARAILELTEKVRRGFDLGITVDGPKGPRFVVKPGSLQIAKLTGAPVVPITTSSNRHWTFNSWDEFQVPKPFARVYVRHGEPVFVDANAEEEGIEAARQLLEDRLREITRLNDERAR